MRVLMVNDLPIESGWGAEAHVGRLAAALETAGDDVDVFAGEIAHHGVGKALDLWDPLARRALRERAERFRPDVVHHHNVIRELSVSVLGVPAGVPTVMTVHEHRLLGIPDRPQRGIRELVTIPLSGLQRQVIRRRVDVVIGVSRHMTAKLKAAGFPRVAHLPQFAARPPASVEERPVGDATDVVVASRLSREKGIPVLAEAFAQIADRHEGTRLVVAGDGPEAQTLSGLQRRLGADRVRLLGKVAQSEVQSLFARARVVVVPSIYTEGAPTTPIEAALVGRPVIVSTEPGLREFVDESGGGEVVAAGSVAALADSLDRLLSDPALAVRLADSGRRYAEQQRTTTAIVPTIRAIYERAIAIRSDRVTRP